MLLRIICLAFIASFISCSKDSQQSTPTGTVSFIINGALYSWNEQNDDSREDYLTMAIYSAGTGAYRFSATNEYSVHLHPLRMVYLTMMTNSLVTNSPFTYSNTTQVDPSYPPHQISVSNISIYDPVHYYSAYGIGDFATVTITKIHDNRADGTFSARMTRLSDSTSINITDGVFKNVEIQP
jgi:hypothetical protein